MSEGWAKKAEEQEISALVSFPAVSSAFLSLRISFHKETNLKSGFRLTSWNYTKKELERMNLMLMSNLIMQGK